LCQNSCRTTSDKYTDGIVAEPPALSAKAKVEGPESVDSVDEPIEVYPGPVGEPLAY